MNNIKNFLLLASFLMSMTFVSGQTVLEQGSITMEITDVDSDNQQMLAQLEMMKGTESHYSFNKDYSLVTTDMMGGMMKMENLVVNKDEHLTLLFDMMGQKMMIESTKAERDKMKAEEEVDMSGYEVVYDKEDTKEILGYQCHKATITGDEDFPLNFAMYVTSDIKASAKMIQGLDSFEIDGFPLEYIMEMENMAMTYSATDLSDSVDSSVFQLNTAGYTKMTLQEFKDQMGAMGGNFGF